MKWLGYFLWYLPAIVISCYGIYAGLGLTSWVLITFATYSAGSCMFIGMKLTESE